MKQLWAPWRMGYILSNKKENGCVFCNAYNSYDDEDKLVIYRDKYAFVIMNLYPYNTGHMMVVPNRHIDSLNFLKPEEELNIFNLVNKSIDVLNRAVSPEGFNVGMNLGRIAGAGIDDHIHIHIVPRWNGDTNFMPVVSDTKVISESISETYKKLKEYFGG